MDTESSRATGGGPLPRWTVLAAVPFAFLLAAALYLHAHWSEIPARFPIHWGIHGQPNGWAGKTVRGVYGPLLFGAGTIVLLLMLGLAVFYGSRRAPLRRPALALIIGVMYLQGLMFAAAGLLPLVHIPVAAFIGAPLVFLAFVILWWHRLRAAKEPSGAAAREFWKLGCFYYNRNDPALFVEKRFGIGYTLNFANPWSWVSLAALAAGMAALILLLPRK